MLPRRTGVVAGLLVGVLAISGCSDDEAEPAASTTTTSTTTTAPATTTTSTTTTTLPDDATTVSPTTVASHEALVAGGSLWLTGTEEQDTGSDTLLRLDLETGEVASRLDVGGAPLYLATAGDLLWVATSESLARVDMTTEQVDVVPLEGVGRMVAASEDTVWVDDDQIDPHVTVVDPETLETRTLDVIEDPSGIVLDVVIDDGTAWVAVDAGDTAVRAFDLATDEPVDDFADPWDDEGVQPVELALVDDELWACGTDLGCVVADAATGEALREAVLGESIDGEPPRELRELVQAEGSLWLSRSDGQENPDSQYDTSTVVERFDPATGALLGSVFAADSPIRRLAVGDGHVVLVSSANESAEERELVRIDLG